MTTLMVPEQYAMRLGVYATAAEIAHIVALAHIPPQVPPGHPPETAAGATRDAAHKHGLPTLTQGYYGIDLTTGEFIKAAV